MRVQSHSPYFDLEDRTIISLLNVGNNPIHVASEPKTKFKLMCIFRSGCTLATNFW